jgi:hypothetical protein
MKEREDLNCGRGKQSFPTRRLAEQAGEQQSDHLLGDPAFPGSKSRLQVYHCKECHAYHIGSSGIGLARLREFKRLAPSRVHRITCLEEVDPEVEDLVKRIK